MAVESLTTRTIRGVLWTGSAFVLQIVTTLVFYRFLPVADMGLFEWALVIVMLLSLLCDLGLGSALVQYREAEEIHFDSAFWVCLACGGLTTVTVVAAAGPISRWIPAVDPGRMAAILASMMGLVPAAAVSGLFRARLQRDLRWRAMAAAEIVASVVHALTAFALLAGGHGIMSAVYSAVARETALLICLATIGGWRPRLRLRRDALRLLLGFGLNLTGSRCLNYLNSNLARLIILPLMGPAAVGYFSFAYRLTLMPLVRISTIITRVFFPTFSTIQEDDALLQRAYLKATQAVALAYWPVLAAVFVFAPQILALAGPDMTQALWPVRLLALATLIKAVGASVGSIFLAKGRASWALYWSAFSIVVLLPTLYAGVEYGGLIGVCAVIAATGLLFLLLSQHLTNLLIGLSFARYAGALARPALLALFVGGLGWLAHPLLPASPWTGGGLALAASAVLSLGGLRLFAWDLCRGMWSSARGRR